MLIVDFIVILCGRIRIGDWKLVKGYWILKEFLEREEVYIG